MNNIKLEVTIDEANVILEALGGMPFAKVYALVGKIQEQAKQQMNASSQEKGATKEEPSSQEG